MKVDLNKRIEEINSWHWGTVYKLYDTEETAETISEDNARMVKDLILEILEYVKPKEDDYATTADKNKSPIEEGYELAVKHGQTTFEYKRRALGL